MPKLFVKGHVLTTDPTKECGTYVDRIYCTYNYKQMSYFRGICNTRQLCHLQDAEKTVIVALLFKNLFFFVEKNDIYEKCGTCP